MNRAAAKRVVALLVASELSAIIELDGWAEQGLLDCYTDTDRRQIRAAARELELELQRRATPSDAREQSPATDVDKFVSSIGEHYDELERQRIENNLRHAQPTPQVQR